MNIPRIEKKSGFSLIEVVLAIGIFLITVLALVGLIGPTLQSLDEVEEVDEIASVVSSVNAFLQSSPEIAAAGETKFQTIYEAIADDGFATIFVFRAYDADDEIELKVGFSDVETGSASAQISEADIRSTAGVVTAAGSVFRVVLSASSVTPTTPTALRSPERADGIYSLTQDFVDYPEGYLALEARIFAEAPDGSFGFERALADLNTVEPVFTYNTAIVR